MKMGTENKKSDNNRSIEDSILEALGQFKGTDSPEGIFDSNLSSSSKTAESQSEEEKLKELLALVQNDQQESVNPFLTQFSTSTSKNSSSPQPPTFTKLDGGSVDASSGLSIPKPFEEMSQLFTEAANKLAGTSHGLPIPSAKVNSTDAHGGPESVSSDPVMIGLFPSDEGLHGVQAKLYENEHLKVAQKKIEELESQLERWKIENERLASAGELFQKKAEESLILKMEIEKRMKAAEERFVEERRNLVERLEQRDAQVKELEAKTSEFEGRITNDIRKSRARERELENRLELARLERLSLAGSKDEMILELKRQVEQLNQELVSYRKKVTEMTRVIDENQEQFRRTVRALRLALTNLEVNEQIGARVKKAE